MRHGDYAWLALAVAILGYEALAPSGELLTQACDRYRRRHPVLTHLVIAYLAGHLTRLWPIRIDPLHQFAVRAGR